MNIEKTAIGGSWTDSALKFWDDNKVSIVGTLTLGVVAPAIGKHFLKKGLKEIMADKNFRMSDIELEPIIAKAKEAAGISTIPHKMLPMLENAFFVPPNSISESDSGAMYSKIKSNFALGTPKGKAMGEFLQTISDYSHSANGGLIIGQKLSNPQVVAHELGHAKMEHDGGIEYYIQKYSPSLQTVGTLAMLGSLIPRFMGNKELGTQILGAGLGVTAAGLAGKIYTENAASNYGLDIVKDIKMNPKTRALGNRALNYALGTYINNAVQNLAPIGTFTKGIF